MLEELSDAARIKELETDNRRLRRLLDQRDAPAELRHRTRSTLAVLRSIITKSAETDRDLDGYVAHLRDRVSALGRAQVIIDEHGAIDLRKLISEELLAYLASDGDRASIEGPDIELLPRPGLVIALAMHELAVNSVEHGALGSRTGRIEISWSKSIDAEDAIDLIWKEVDKTTIAEPTKRGFGAEVLTRMLPYELKADVTIAFETSGLLCRIRFPTTASATAR